MKHELPRAKKEAFDKLYGKSQSQYINDTQIGSPKKVKLIFDLLKEYSEPIKIIAAVVAGMFALAEYKSSDYVAKVKAASEIMDKFYLSDGYKALVKLDEFWVSERVSALRQNILTGDDAHKYRVFIKDAVSKDYNSDFLKSIRAFKEISICAIQNRCDPSSMCMHMSQTIQDFRCNFRENIIALSAANGSCVVDEISFFVDNYCQPWLASYMGVEKYSGVEDNRCLYDKEEKRFTMGEFCSESIIYKKHQSILNRFLE
jgi:hypothetical protein